MSDRPTLLERLDTMLADAIECERAVKHSPPRHLTDAMVCLNAMDLRSLKEQAAALEAERDRLRDRLRNVYLWVTLQPKGWIPMIEEASDPDALEGGDDE